MSTKLIIDRFEHEKAVLKTEDKETIVLPKSLLPENAYEGMLVFMQINANAEQEQKNQKKAKEILNEILLTD